MPLTLDLAAALELLVDLRRGVHTIRVTPGAAPARIASPARARARVTTNLTMKAGALYLGGAAVDFDPPLTIKNPVAALDPAQSAKWLKDLLADLQIVGVDAGDDGRIAIEARIKPILVGPRPFALPEAQLEQLRLPVPLIGPQASRTTTEAAVAAIVAPILALTRTARSAAAVASVAVSRGRNAGASASAAAAGGSPESSERSNADLAARLREVGGLVTSVRATSLATTDP